MLRKTTLLLLVVPLALVSCEPEPQQEAPESDGYDLDVVDRSGVPRAPWSNNLKLVASDMVGSHEGLPRGVYDNGNPAMSWVSNPRLSYGNDMPRGWDAFQTWGQVYADRSGATAPNTRYQVRNLRGYYLSRSRNEWVELQSTSNFDYGYYEESFQGDVNVPAPTRREPSGGISAKLADGFNFHFFPKQRVRIDPADIVAVWTTFEARLVLDDPAGPDDRGRARILASVGADYWESLTAPWRNWETNGDVGIGKFKYLKPWWRSFNMHSAPRHVIVKKSPPPVAE